mgnify:CR=1 FL=1
MFTEASRSGDVFKELAVFVVVQGGQVTGEICLDDVEKAVAVVIPGGWAPDRLRRYDAVKSLVRDTYERGRIVAAICHAGWVPISVSAAQLRERGLDAWPAAVGVWWPRVGGAGMVVCRPRIEVHPTAAITDRLPHEVALVLVGTRARHAVERQCAAHSGRPDPTAARQSPPWS